MKGIFLHALGKSTITGAAVGLAYWLVMVVFERPIGTVELLQETGLFTLVIIITMMFPFAFFEVENDRKNR